MPTFEPTVLFHFTFDFYQIQRLGSLARKHEYAKIGVRQRLCSSHHQTRKFVTADGKVSSTLQIGPGAATAEEGGA